MALHFIKQSLFYKRVTSVLAIHEQEGHRTTGHQSESYIYVKHMFSRKHVPKTVNIFNSAKTSKTQPSISSIVFLPAYAQIADTVPKGSRLDSLTAS